MAAYRKAVWTKRWCIFDKAIVLLRNPLHAIYSYFHFTMASRVQHIDRRRALHNYSLTDEELARFAGAAPGATWWTGPGWLHFVESGTNAYVFGILAPCPSVLKNGMSGWLVMRTWSTAQEPCLRYYALYSLDTENMTHKSPPGPWKCAS